MLNEAKSPAKIKFNSVDLTDQPKAKYQLSGVNLAGAIKWWCNSVKCSLRRNYFDKKSIVFAYAFSNSNLSAKSSQFGFSASIKAIFLPRDLPFSDFSLLIAVNISSHTSKYTRTLTAHYLANRSTKPSRC